MVLARKILYLYVQMNPVAWFQKKKIGKFEKKKEKMPIHGASRSNKFFKNSVLAEFFVSGTLYIYAIYNRRPRKSGGRIC